MRVQATHKGLGIGKLGQAGGKAAGNQAALGWALAVAALLAALGVWAMLRVLWAGLPLLPAAWHTDLDVVWRTLQLVASALLLSLGLGTGLALLVVGCRLGALADILVSSAYFLPPFIGATAWLAALGPGNPLTGQAIVNLYSPGGIVLVWTLHFAPLAYLLVRTGLSAQGDTLRLAGQVHGLRPLQTFRAITWPLLQPSLRGAALLIGLSLLGNFGVPAVLGFSAKLYTLATLSYARLLNPTLADPLASAAAAAWLLLLTSLPLLLLPRPQVHTGGTPLPLPPARQPLAWAVVGLWFALTFLWPLLSIIRLAFKPLYSSGWTWQQFSDTLALHTVQRGLLISVGLALLTGLLCTALGLWLARRLSGLAAGRLLERLLAMPYFLPGTLLALGLILCFGGTPLYATPLLLLLAYLLRFITPGLEAAQTSLTPQQQQLEFAARVHGLSKGQTLRRITLPLLRPHITNALSMIVPLALSEVTLSALLYAPGAETAGVAVLNLLSEGNLPGAAALSCLLLLLILPPVLWSRVRHG